MLVILLLVLCLFINLFMTFYFGRKHWKAVKILHAVVFPVLCFFYIFSLTDPDLEFVLSDIFGESFYYGFHTLLIVDGHSDVIPYFAIVFSSIVMFICVGILTAKERIISCRNDNAIYRKNRPPRSSASYESYEAGDTKVYIKLCSLLC